jgi:hypothetical protein
VTIFRRARRRTGDDIAPVSLATALSRVLLMRSLSLLYKSFLIARLPCEPMSVPKAPRSQDMMIWSGATSLRRCA